MKTHFSEADLLETYYMQPGESMPVMMHLASCEMCAARYDALERKLRESAACSSHEKPETFWTRQRLMIQRRIDNGRERTTQRGHALRVAAAAVLAFFLGSVFTLKTTEPKQETSVAASSKHAPVAQQAPAAADELQQSHDPWQSDQLSDFHSVVEWESWVDEGKKL